MTEARDNSRRGASFYPRGMFSSLLLADYRCVWLANLAASFAMQMEMVARGWLIYDMTNSPLALTWVMLSSMLPSVVFSLAGGVIADRLGKKKIIITAQVLSTAAMFVLATIVYQGHVTFWHFIWFGMFNGTVMSLSMPARSSIIPELVGRRYVVNAMALQTSTFNLSRILGPTLAGALIAAFAAGDTTSTTGVGIVYYVIGGLFTTSIIATSMMRYRRNPGRRRDTSVLTDVGEGFRYMKQERIVVGLLIMGIGPMTFGFSSHMLLPAFNADAIGGGPQDLGLILTAMGAGALAGSLTLARLGDISRKGRVMFAAAYLWAVALAVFALSSNTFWAMFLGLFTGLFGSIMGSLNMSIVQLAIRPDIRGRVMSINMMTFALTPLGVIPISAAAEFVGIEIGLLISASLLALTTALLGRAYPELQQIDKGHGRAMLRRVRPERSAAGDGGSQQ
ncbi:MAG: MFS transporter [Gammaproteobacteria bacterium]|nr:MFS transporter [Gammaproteobacteria bacterium]